MEIVIYDHHNNNALAYFQLDLALYSVLSLALPDDALCRPVPQSRVWFDTTSF